MKQIFFELKDDFRDIDWRIIIITIFSSIALLLIFYIEPVFTKIEFVRAIWGNFSSIEQSFFISINWFSSYFILYLVIPFSCILLFFKADFQAFGLGFSNLKKYIHIYLICIFIMLPIIFIASSMPSFKNTYPFMKSPIITYIIIWEILYMIQFIAVEFLFRGFLLFPFCERFGVAGILFHIAPYALIHITKPLPEAIGSVFAGLLLGYFAYKSRSIWGGVLLHCVVALSMDILAILH